MIQTVIFDMDGVIIDTEPVHHYAYHEHFRLLDIEVSPELYASFTGNSTKNIFEKLKEQFGLSEEVAQLVLQKRRLFNEAFDKKTDLYLLKGVRELIEDLYQNGIQLVVASSASKETINRVFNRFGLHRYFSHIVSGEDFPKSKPHPAIFLKAAALAATPVSDCVVIEDSTNGILAAKAAGIYCIGYDSFHSKLQDYSKADMVISDFSLLNAAVIRTINYV